MLTPLAAVGRAVKLLLARRNAVGRRRRHHGGSGAGAGAGRRGAAGGRHGVLRRWAASALFRVIGNASILVCLRVWQRWTCRFGKSHVCRGEYGTVRMPLAGHAMMRTSTCRRPNAVMMHTVSRQLESLRLQASLPGSALCPCHPSDAGTCSHNEVISVTRERRTGHTMAAPASGTCVLVGILIRLPGPGGIHVTLALASCMHVCFQPTAVTRYPEPHRRVSSS